MPALKLCATGCGRLALPTKRHCHECGSRAAQRRLADRRASGRDTQRWRKLRKQTLERDGYSCQLRLDDRCTFAADTVHLHPELNGNHRQATLALVVSSCRHCNSSEGATKNFHDTTKSFEGGRHTASAAPAEPHAARISPEQDFFGVR